MAKKTNQPIPIGQVLMSDKPRQIINQVAYDEYLKYKNNPLFAKGRFQTASDGGVLDLSWFPNLLQKRIEHLPEAEQNKFMKLKQAYATIQNKANGFLKGAYAGNVISEKGDTKESMFAPRKQDLIELFGRMFSVKEVYQIATQDWKMPCSVIQLSGFRMGNIEEIIAKIEEHKRTYSDIRLGHKRSRLEELTWLYMKRKAIYNTSGKADDHRLLLATIEQIRKEAEGDKITLDGNVTHNIDGAVNDLIEKDLTKNLSIKELILARVAAKTGRPVATLVSDLSKGWYSKILNREATDAVVEIEYPSTQPYDFDQIGRIAAANEIQEKNQAKEAPISVEIITAGNDIKAILLAKLTAKRGDVQSEKNDLNPHFIDKANK